MKPASNLVCAPETPAPGSAASMGPARRPADKPDIPDGLQLVHVWRRYLEATRPLWGLFPECLAAGFLLILSEPAPRSPAAWARSARRAGRWALDTLRRSRPPEHWPPPCQALIFRSSNKPSVHPVLSDLARRLAAEGRDCLVMLHRNRLEWFAASAGGGEPRVADFPDYPRWIQAGVGRGRALALMLWSVPAALALKCRLAGMGGEAISHADIFQTWRTLAASRLRREFLKGLLERTRPRLVVVNMERVEIGAELAALARETGARGALFLNELPLAGLAPVLGDQVWVWNSTAAESLKAILGNGPLPEILEAGSAEAALGREPGRIIRLEGRPGRPKVVYLVEESDSVLRGRREICRLAASWISRAARLCPQWDFLIKPRLGQNPSAAAEAHLAAHRENIWLLEKDYRTVDLFRRPEVKAVVGLCSTALFTAAAAGKAVGRMWISRRQFSIPVLDEASRALHGFEDLAAMLHEIQAGAAPVTRQADHASYQEILDRLTSLCLHNLDRPEPGSGF